jgi:uncharacterized protein (TIGR00369 family)
MAAMTDDPQAPRPLDPAAFMTATVPMVRTLNLVFDRATAEQAVVRLPDQASFHNHLGGPHAGAMFTLAETASGAVLLANFGHLLGRAVPLAVSSDIQYLKLARGEVTATARLTRPAAEVTAELDAGERPEFTVEVEITRPDGETSGRMSIVWTLRPNS